MKLDILTAISPVDGRYRGKTEKLADYFSEYALIRYRVRVEIEYFISLCELPLPQLSSFDKGLFDRLRGIYRNFSEDDARRVKEIEKTTNHDVKAVERNLSSSWLTMPKSGRMCLCWPRRTDSQPHLPGWERKSWSLSIVFSSSLIL